MADENNKPDVNEQAEDRPVEESVATAGTADTSDVEKNKVFGILAYLGILFIVPLLAAKESKFAMYHANQGLVLFIFWVILTVVWMIPILGWLVGFFGSIFAFVLMIMGIINAANGEMKPLPLIGGYELIK